MKEKIRDTKFRTDSLARIEQMVTIVEEYAAQGLKLTARQLYYQFVSRDLAPNTPRSYKNLTALLADARYAGLVDWDAIEDRGREPTQWSDYENVAEAVEQIARSFRLPRWNDQPNYVELWVEKQALAGVLEPLAMQFHVTMLVNKGYSSASAMYESAERFKEHRQKDCTLFYLGDHDPSGEDMVRDIRDRLEEFGANVEVEKLALTMAQVRQYKPPPNPAKMTDSRAAGYVAEHGDSSWEVDALPPDVLSRLIRTAFAGVVNKPKMDAVIAREKTQRTRLVEAAKRIAEEDA